MELLKLEGICKSFGATAALAGADLVVNRGSVHALLGENGAGKSTLMNVVAGVVQPDSGRLQWKGVPARFRTPLDATRAGIKMIHQELSLVPQMTIAENIFLGQWPARGRFWLDPPSMERRAQELLAQVGLDRPAREPVGSLSLAEMQQVEIARALCLGSDLIIMDEPTSSLSVTEIQRLFGRIRDLVRKGVAVIYISHRLEEVDQVAETVTVMRDGRTVASARREALPRSDVIRLMSGAGTGPAQGVGRTVPGKELFRAENISVDPNVRGVGLTVLRGEVVGLAGLMGSGRTDLVLGLFGERPLRSGRVFLNGRAVAVGSAREAIRLGIGLLTEDRRRTGLVPAASVHANAVLAAPAKHSRMGFFSFPRERLEVDGAIRRLSIRTPGADTPVHNLSGGNQQKVILARWLYAETEFLILDEPTRGIDVTARAQIYRLIEELSRSGKGILLVSSDLQELLHACHRILVMREGRMVGEVPAGTADEETVLKMAVGG